MQNNAAYKKFMFIPSPLSEEAVYFPFSASPIVKLTEMLRDGVVTRSSPFACSIVPHNTWPPSMSHGDTLHPPYLLPKGEGETWYWSLCLQLGSPPGSEATASPAACSPFEGISFCVPSCHGTDKQVRKDDRKIHYSVGEKPQSVA